MQPHDSVPSPVQGSVLNLSLTFELTGPNGFRAQTHSVEEVRRLIKDHLGAGSQGLSPLTLDERRQVMSCTVLGTADEQRYTVTVRRSRAGSESSREERLERLTEL